MPKTEINDNRLNSLIPDIKPPRLEGGESWAAVSKVLTRLKIAGEANEESIVLYLWQLERDDSIWRNESKNHKWNFATFIRRNDIYDPTRYGDCVVALAQTPLEVLKKIGLNAAVLVTKKLRSKFYKAGFDTIVDYMATNQKKSSLLKLEVSRLIAKVGEAYPGSLTKKVRVDSRTLAKTELAKANETIKDLRRTIESLESKLQASEAKNRKLQTQVDGFRAANRKGSRRRGLKAA